MTTIIKYFISLIFIIIFVFGCNASPIITLDQYNPPYNVTAIPGDTPNSIKVRFVSGITATDFAGFNIYVDDFTPFDAALTNSTGGKPTIHGSNHSRQHFEYVIPRNFTPGTLYEIAVTAYGTNDLAENRRIETSISPRSISKCVPRAVNTGVLIATGNYGGITFTFTPTTVSASGYGIQYFGECTNFNQVTVVTNNNITNFITAPVPLINKGLYIAYDNNITTYVKIWVDTTSSTMTWASQNNPGWNGI